MPQTIDWIAIARENPGVVDQHIQLNAGRIQLPWNAVDQTRGCHVKFERAGPCAFGIELAAGILKRPQRAPCEDDTVSIFKKQPGGFKSESAICSGDHCGFLLHGGMISVMATAGIKLGKSLMQGRCVSEAA
jgi:pyruvate/2-oxoacid:ferredoxin oxidoreductase beta subunit